MLKTQIKTAVIQMSAGENKEANIDKALKLVSQAAQKGAETILLPECFLYRGRRIFENNVAESVHGPSVKRFQLFAKKKGVVILLGSIHEKSTIAKKVYNTSVCIDSEGKVLGAYRKIHLFEANLLKKAVRETDVFLAGKKRKVFHLGAFSAGSAICYDLRFPEMFRSYAKKGCEIFFVPSNFTYETGRAHWEVLVRARAIENRCYVLAPNQHGTDAQGLRSYGNSMIVDPWGNIIKRAGSSADEILFCMIEKKEIMKARERLP